MSPASSAVPAVPAPEVSGSGSPVSLHQISHRYGDSVAVKEVSLTIGAGELVALLGPSGCGKTTLLRVIAGLLSQTGGRVQIGERMVDELPTAERGVGIVFQSYALFPHMTVRANVAYGLRARGVAAATIERRVDEMLAMVRMSGFAARYPRELSGGQQQRVALARTLAVSPQVLLLDEPFAALDKNLRLDMQIEIRRIQRELGITTVLVTHDQDEAMSMADRIAVMNTGSVEQYDTPEAIYDRPATRFVAGFVGTANCLTGRLQRDGAGWRLSADVGGEIGLATAAPCSREGPVQVMVRPEHLQLVAPQAGSLSARLVMMLPLGPSLVYELSLSDGTPIKVTASRHGDPPRLSPGEAVGLALRPDAPVAVFLPDVAP